MAQGLLAALLLCSLSLSLCLHQADARDIVVGAKNSKYDYPWNPANDYQQWSSKNPLFPGDTLVFYYAAKVEVVYVARSEQAFHDCSAIGAVKACDSVQGSKKEGCRIQVTSEPLYVISVKPHCKMGQKLLVQASMVKSHNGVKSVALSLAPAPAPGPSSGNATDGGDTTITAGGVVYKVGYPTALANWYFNPTVNYSQWARTHSLFAGSLISFNFPAYSEEVYQFPRWKDWNSCNIPASRRVCTDTSGTQTGCVIQVQQGTRYYASGNILHCNKGMKLAIYGQKKPYVPRTLIVGYPSRYERWNWNLNGRYSFWLSHNKLYVGDTLVFVYPANMNEVFMVPTLADYQNCNYANYISYCNGTDGTGGGCYSAPLARGASYFISGFYSNCMAGQRIAAIATLPP